MPKNLLKFKPIKKSKIYLSNRDKKVKLLNFSLNDLENNKLNEWISELENNLSPFAILSINFSYTNDEYKSNAIVADRSTYIMSNQTNRSLLRLINKLKIDLIKKLGRNVKNSIEELLDKAL